MSELTAGEILALRESLEFQAATLLGHMLFDLSRLDVNLGLCLVWVDCSAYIQERTKVVEGLTFKAKLDEMSKYVEAKLPNDSMHKHAYFLWIKQAHAVRKLRNNLVHGRWGVEPRKGKIVNVIGLPTSQDQKVLEYSIAELAAINIEVRRLHVELSRLRELSPL